MISALASRVAAYIGHDPATITYRTSEEYRRQKQGLLAPPELTTREAAELDLELEDLAALTRVHGPWRAAQLMNWSHR